MIVDERPGDADRMVAAALKIRTGIDVDDARHRLAARGQKPVGVRRDDLALIIVHILFKLLDLRQTGKILVAEDLQADADAL